MKIKRTCIAMSVGLLLCCASHAALKNKNTVAACAKKPVQNKNSNPNLLNKLFHHRSLPNALELGQLVLYFDQEVQPLPAGQKKLNKMMMIDKKQPVGINNNETQAELLFVFPGIKINNSAQAMIHAINRLSKLPYHVTIKTAHDELKISIKYDPEKVAVESEKFVAIDLQKGVTFRFFNKELLDSLRNKGVPMLRTAALKKKHGIVVDCGHGGADFGAMSADKLSEKAVTLDVGLQLAQLLRQDGYEVFLTRDSDTTLALDERTTFTNMSDADLFISIHANHAGRTAASGIETFCLKDSLFKHCFCNLDSSAMAPIEKIFKERNKQSNVLASCLHTQILAAVKKNYTTVVDRGIKHATPQVLMGITKPGALMEIGFLSNPEDAVRLADKNYKKSIAVAIRNGIRAYFDDHVV